MIESVDWTKVAALITAGACMSIGGLGPSLGQGFIAGKACENIGKRPENGVKLVKKLES